MITTITSSILIPLDGDSRSKRQREWLNNDGCGGGSCQMQTPLTADVLMAMMGFSTDVSYK